MVVQHGIKLAVNIISTHFGTLVTKVCECLLRKGTFNLPEIVRYTELPVQQVKHSLLVLIQHNCVQPFVYKNEEDQGHVPRGTHYKVIFENIIHRMRFPKFLAIVSEELDKECVELLEGLLQHGRLTLEQVILRAISKRNEGDRAVQDALRANFVKLVDAHYVERCPASEPIANLQDEGKNPSTRKRGAKSAKFVQIESAEEQAMTSAIPSERFVVIANTGADVTSERNTSENLSNVAVGEKRKAFEMDEGTNAMMCEKEVLWRVNFEEFVRHLRHKACAASVTSRLDDGAGVILKAMLEATRRVERKIKIEKSAPLSEDAIFGEVMKTDEGRTMAPTQEHVRVALSQLGCHPNSIGTEETYSVDLKNIIEIAQNSEIESLVSKRYGQEACRIFRLLSRKDEPMETDKISDTAFIEKTEALKLLYNLWKDGYLHMEKLFAPPYSVLLLWRVNKILMRDHVYDEMCHAALNLRLRLAHELEQEREILQLPKDKRIGAPGKRFERIRKINILLESSLMKLDEALMLFHDF
ncbi:Dna-directed rna polymerase iii subunit rpc3 [Thalictrum thalictroides]|uniref:DNA-directed RNA polymerase III subunit RPC3 n=1 Tax=Thalictrum thalictroides TaxID=46969 RepID=A0A7J6WG34_THATH|nr:Dna-directed rna polymerase iii subunit rpc3 [Thalictrum thalictroides]